MPVYTTPGLYYETFDASAGGINPVRTDIAAFIGIARQGPLQQPTPVTTFQQFQSTFGQFISQGYLAYSVKAFFDNGGARCQIVRVAAGPLTTTSSGPQPADGTFSMVVSAAGFVVGAVATVRLDESHQADHQLSAVDYAANKLTWSVPLEPMLLTGGGLEFDTGASPSEGVLYDALGVPTLSFAASSPGEWGNQLEVETSYGSSAATQTTTAVQPPSGAMSYVSTLAGFSAGTLVKAFQVGGPNVTEYHVVASINYSLNALVWDTPLTPAFNLAQPISFESVEFTLSVFLLGDLRETYTRLSLVPSSANYVVTVVNTASQQIVVTDLQSPSPAPSNLPDPQAPNLQDARLELVAGRDGIAALSTFDFTGDALDASPRGLTTLVDVEEVAIVAIPDILIQPAPPPQYLLPVLTPGDPCALCPGKPAPPAPPPPPLYEAPPQFSLDQIEYVQQALISHCETAQYRIAVLDPPLFSAPNESKEIAEIQGWRQRFDSSYAALYFPWVLVYDPLQLGGEVVRAIPPSGHVAGCYASTDLTIGVHKAPANTSLAWIQDVLADVDPATQGLLNPTGINCIRTFPGRGIRIYGARTVSRDTNWTFVNVRRLLMMIEKACHLSLRWAVFEPNNVQFRLRVRTALTVFLESIFQGGALAGNTDADSFYVKCDGENNPQSLAANGQFVAEVGVAPARPAEFVVFRVGRTEDSLEVTE
jgi:Bacteriophage tail sheath protein